MLAFGQSDRAAGCAWREAFLSCVMNKLTARALVHMRLSGSIGTSALPGVSVLPLEWRVSFMLI